MSTNTIYKQLPTRVEAVGDRRLRFVISTDAVDRDNDTINQSGWKLDSFLRNPVVLFAHDYSSLPVAKCTDLRLNNGQLIATAEFPPEGLYPFADQVFAMLKDGFLNATSVGFRPVRATPNAMRGGTDFTEQELLEFSIVPVPANPEAVMVGRSVNNTAAYRKWLGVSDDANVLDVDDETKAGREVSAANHERHRAIKASHDYVQMCLSDARKELLGAGAHLGELLRADNRPANDESILDVVDWPADDIDARQVAEVLPMVLGNALKEASPRIRRLVRHQVLDGWSIELDDIAEVLPSIVQDSIRDALNEVIREEVGRTVRRARGRLD